MHHVTIPTPAVSLSVYDSADPAAPRDEDGRAPVVLLHGMLTDAGAWEAMLPHLRAARAHRVVRPELRGHGASSAPGDGDYSIAACADDLQRALDALGLDRVDLVGHSYGSLVALEAAAREPRRYRRLVLADPPGALSQLPDDVRRNELEPYLAALAGEGWREAATAGFENALGPDAAPASRELILGRMAGVSKALVLGMMRSMFAYDPLRALDAYAGTPGAIVHAILAPSNAWPYSLHVLRPSLPTTVIPRVGHWLQIDAPEAFAAALDAALGAAEPAQGSRSR